MSRVRTAVSATKLLLATVSLTAALLAAGCGGDGGGEALSADEFRQEADRICAEFETKLDDVEPPNSPDDIRRFVEEAVPIIEDGTDQLNSLEPPSEFQDEWDRITEINEENLDTVRAVRDALENEDLEEATRLMEEAGGNEKEADQLARDIGLTKCGQDTG
jgi:hypothetical protein